MILIAPATSYTATYEVSLSLKPVGTQVETVSLAPDGSGRREIKLTMKVAGAKVGGAAVSYRLLSLLGPGGARRRDVQDLARGGVKTQTIADYDAAGASLTLTDAKGRRVVRLDAPTGVSRRDPTRGWYGKGAPGVGTEATYAELDLTAARWNVVTARYKGENATDRRYRGLERLERTTLDDEGILTTFVSVGGSGLRRLSLARR